MRSFFVSFVLDGVCYARDANADPPLNVCSTKTKFRDPRTFDVCQLSKRPPVPFQILSQSRLDPIFASSRSIGSDLSRDISAEPFQRAFFVFYNTQLNLISIAFRVLSRSIWIRLHSRRLAVFIGQLQRPLDFI